MIVTKIFPAIMKNYLTQNKFTFKIESVHFTTKPFYALTKAFSDSVKTPVYIMCIIGYKNVNAYMCGGQRAYFD